MIPMLSKRLVIALATVPVLLGAASTPPAQQQPCDMDCPFWGMEEMEKFFNHPLARTNPAYSASTMKEEKKAYLISIDLPGMDKKDISIETSGNRLTVSGERREESESKETSKRSFAQFRQSYSLPEDADMSAISATSVNGVLKITVPKTGKKISRKIEVK